MASDPRGRSGLAERLTARRRAHRQRSALYRGAFVVAGALVTLLGLAMLVLPGPALVIIPIGLAMLALEFDWAERALVYALHRAEDAQRTAREASPAKKALGVLATAVAVGACVAAAVLYDIPLLPV